MYCVPRFLQFLLLLAAAHRLGAGNQPALGECVVGRRRAGTWRSRAIRTAGARDARYLVRASRRVVAGHCRRVDGVIDIVAADVTLPAWWNFRRLPRGRACCVNPDAAAADPVR